MLKISLFLSLFVITIHLTAVAQNKQVDSLINLLQKAAAGAVKVIHYYKISGNETAHLSKKVMDCIICRKEPGN
jgi:hypothetical protein